MIKYQAGTIDPSEYNWEEQFSFEDEMEPFITMDVGKVRGLAIALERSEAEVVEVYTNALAIGERRGMEKAAEIVKEAGYEFADEAIRKEIQDD